MEIIIDEPLSKIILRLAKNSDKDIYMLLSDLVAERLDPDERISIYIALYRKFFDEAKKLEDEGDIVQASEKLWGSVTALLNIVGEKKRMPHYTHRDYWEIMNKIFDDTKDDELLELFALAEKLHANFYHDFIPKHQFPTYSKKLEVLLEKLKKYIKELGVDV